MANRPSTKQGWPYNNNSNNNNNINNMTMTRVSSFTFCDSSLEHRENKETKRKRKFRGLPQRDAQVHFMAQNVHHCAQNSYFLCLLLGFYMKQQCDSHYLFRSH